MKSKQTMLKEVLKTTEVYVNRFRRVEKIRVTTPKKEKQKAMLMLFLGIMAKMSSIQYDVINAQPLKQQRNEH